MTTQQINAIIDYGNNIIMSAIFNDLLKAHETVSPKLQKKWQEYDGEVEILKRTQPIGTPAYKSHNKIPIDLRSLIVDQGITYFVGNPVGVSVVNDTPNKDVILKALKDFSLNNSLDDQDLETALYAAVCGFAARLLYIDKKGQERSMVVPPWEVIFVYDHTTKELQYGLIYYKVQLVNARTKAVQEMTRIEWYDKKNVYYYIQSENPSGDKDSFYKLDETEQRNPLEHGFDGVPLVEILNNDMRKGDFDRVGPAIDARDRLISDAQNELEDFRNAYMLFKGLAPDVKTMESAKLTGAFGSEDPDFDVSFITKNPSVEFYNEQKNTLNDDIFRVSKRVDMNDEKFSGATQTGENRKWKMLGLENDSVMKERKYTKALREMYKLLFTVWSKKGIAADVTMLEFTFTRKLPIDLEYYGTIVSQLDGKVPKRILFGLLPFITDVDKAIEELEEENVGKVDLNKFGDQPDNDNEDDNL